jgi:Fur family zinc uptake transcriptional regulator
MTLAQFDAFQPMAHHSNNTAYEDGVSNALRRAESLCRGRGVRLTPIRRRVLEVLLGASKPLGAYDLAEALTSGGRRTAPITVYRALDFLIEEGLAHRLASLNAFMANMDASNTRVTKVFLICDACGTVESIAGDEITQALGKVMNGMDFQSKAKALEITGRCAHCQGVH